MSKMANKFAPEVRERAVRMVFSMSVITLGWVDCPAAIFEH